MVPLRRRWRRKAGALVVLGLLGAHRANAQSTPSGPSGGTVPGFVIESNDGDNRLQFGGLLHIDGRHAADDPRPDVDTFLMRRMRPIVQGRIARHFEYLFVPELAGARNVRDAYVDIRFSSAFGVRVGKGKVPFGLERLHGANSLLFAERALPTALGPDRQVGLQVLGSVLSGRVSYAAAVVNGRASGRNDTDTDRNEEVAGRIIVAPWTNAPQHPLSGLGIGVAATTGGGPGALPIFRSAVQQTFFAYADGVREGHRHRLSPQGFYYRGPFGGFAEYVQSTTTIRQGAISRDVDHTAWQVAGSWVVTGEAASDHGVRPRATFDPTHGTFGALQVAARYHVLRVGTDAFTYLLAAPDASRTAEAYTVGVNWYLNPLVKWVFNLERTVFDGDAGSSRPAENAIVFRGQLSF